MRVGLGVTLSALIGASLPAAMAQSALDLAAGHRSYQLLCAQCHGSDGDALNYADIVPLAGIKRRYPPDVIGRLSGSFSGRTLTGKDREQVVQYLASLRGAKGFADPGWLMTPQMLERKAPRIHEFRVIDVRSKQAYDAGHVSNALSVEPGPCIAGPEETAQWLGQLGVTPTTVVVVYDETGGPAAACTWWRIRRAGHPWVAVMDGGWKRWTAEGRFTDKVDPRNAMVPRIQLTDYPPQRMPPPCTSVPASVPVLSLDPKGWSWEHTLGDTGFRNYEELLGLAEAAGLRPGVAIRLDAPPEQLAHLALVLHLLGYETGCVETSVIRIVAPAPPV